MTTDFHNPVLLHSSIEFLINPQLDKQVIFDGTLGGGGYSELICETISADSRLIAVDKDINAIEFSKNRLKKWKEKISFYNGNFAEIKKISEEAGSSSLTGVVLDLGLSSYQLNEENGFSYMRESELDMRADKNSKVQAKDILNNYSENELTRIFREYGEIKRADRLSRAICHSRKFNRINTTTDLNDLIFKSYGFRNNVPVKFLSKIYQSIRIEVNNELDDLHKVLAGAFDLLVEGGRIVVISYHSLEDRIVKNFFRKFYYKNVVSGKSLNILTKKVVTPDYSEVLKNSRARSAKLRAAEVVMS